MRVITGSAKGRRLLSPKSGKIRPALDQVKEAIFNILFDVTDLHILDLFAGTGSMGIEAISRGARSATFVDDFASATELIKKNLKLCGFLGHARVIKSSAISAIKLLSRRAETFNIIFVDPPYLKNLVNPTLKVLAESTVLTPATIIIIEHHPKEPIEPPTGLCIWDTRKYGQTIISFLKQSPPFVREGKGG